ncbi:thioredoxin family protein [Micromonospora carbonacea subsp. aurantiaca]|uniref:Thioredoxin family protein n=1 Tax=Micromonospora carbonacea TaxID=47853 RepID=A0A7H8XQ72_9ACTN|nr:thioredoxin family protein [Micromonospora carbonacea]
MGTDLGLWHPGPVRDQTLTGVLLVAGVLGAATGFGRWRRRRDGRLRSVVAAAPPVPPAHPDRWTPAVDGGTLPQDPRRALLARLGARPGAVTLVQFSSAVCAPCRATRRVLEQVEAAVAGVVLVEVDAERHLDAVRELDVWRTPTVLVVDPAGRVVLRAAGVPVRDDLVAAVTKLLAGADR